MALTRQPIRTGVPQIRVAHGALADLAYRLNRTVLYSLMLAYVPLTFLTASALAYGAFRLTQWTFHTFWGAPRLGGYFVLLTIGLDLAVVTTIALLLFGLLPLFFRNVIPQPYGERLDPQRHPNLHGVVGRLCKRLRTRVPDTCLLTPFEHTGIGDLTFVDAEGVVHRRVRTLLLGAAHVVHTRAHEFVTILCHEIAHTATGDTWMSRLSYRLHASLKTQVELQDRRNTQKHSWLNFFLTLVLMSYYYVFTWLYCRDHRYRELRADRIAAEICGPQNVRRALIETHLVGYLPELSIERLWLECCQNDRDIANLYAEHRRRWENLSPQRQEAAENEMFMARASVWHSHPALADRIRNLQGVDAKELKMDHPATKLFHHWEALEHQITLRVVAAGRAMHEQYLNALDRDLQLSR
jgi:hypothetical protein